MKTLAIIVTYNGVDYIRSCLDSLGESCDVVVVDNDSSDETTQCIKNSYPSVRLIELNENIGFGQANNIGMQYAIENGYEFAALVNQDVYLSENVISDIQILHYQNPDYGILSCVHLNKNRDDYDINFLNYASKNEKLISDMDKSQMSETIYEIPFVNAAFWHVSLYMIQNVGGFDPMFFHYGEDRNLCQRAAYHGFKVGIAPKFTIVHDREIVKIDAKPNSYKREVKLMSQWGDVNIDNMKPAYDKQKNELLRDAVKALLILNFKLFKDRYSEYKIMRDFLPTILNSRETNIVRGPHHLG